VSIERIFHCDGPECERHVQTADTRPPVFLTVTEDVDSDLHFCSWDCVLRFAAEKPPAEVVPMAAD
jgi:hypothetical protein